MTIAFLLRHDAFAVIEIFVTLHRALSADRHALKNRLLSCLDDRPKRPEFQPYQGGADEKVAKTQTTRGDRVGCDADRPDGGAARLCRRASSPELAFHHDADQTRDRSDRGEQDVRPYLRDLRPKASCESRTPAVKGHRSRGRIA